MPSNRKFPIGAEFISENSVSFRVWAPQSQKVDLIFESQSKRTIPLQNEGNGYFSIQEKATAGTNYRFLLNSEGPYPDPASRSQPEGPHGTSQIIDSQTFQWTDYDWKGISANGQVLYEMHIGTFTQEGTWNAARQQLKELAAIGITCIEVMPVNEFPGRFGWGYDGVNLFAPSHLYGSPDDFRQFVDEAHHLNIGVILDVVYNHIGPDGNYLGKYSKHYFSTRHKTEWGEAINFDDTGSAAVREFFITNAAYWIDEFHLDGLRLDATQNIYDDASPERHILTDIGRAVRRAAKGRSTFIVNENECQHAELVRPVENGGYGLDALWNDDYHHAAVVAVTGRSEAYYSDYRGEPQELVSALKYGYLYQGQWYSWQKQRRGHSALDLPAHSFINFLQNHDQIANSAKGMRLHQITSPGRYRAIHAVTLLGPGTPMLFQGQEFESSSPFFYFADHHQELAKLVQNGRIEFLKQFPGINDESMIQHLAPPHSEDTFKRCQLNFEEREIHSHAYRLTKDLLHFRRNDSAFRETDLHRIDGAVLGPQAFVLRYFLSNHMDRIILVNLGRTLDLKTCPEPLLAPPAGCQWSLVLSTDDPQYGGSGSTCPEKEDGWLLSAESTTVLIPTKIDFSKRENDRAKSKS